MPKSLIIKYNNFCKLGDFAYMHLEGYQGWIELFGLVDSEPIEQKRILSIVSGAILPLVALGCLDALIFY